MYGVIRGVARVPCVRVAPTSRSFVTNSAGEEAQTPSQKDSRSLTTSPRSFLKSAYQTKRAQIAPPEPNFRELRKGGLRRIPLLRGWVNKHSRRCLRGTHGTYAPDAQFRA